MINNPIIFYISSGIIILFALLTLFCKNIIHSLLSSIVVFFAAAVIFYVLGSEYNAIIQAAIYGFAVPVIIGLSIMFTTGIQYKKKNFALPYLTVLCGIIFTMAAVYIIMISLSILPDTFNLTEIPQVNSYDILSSFAKGVFINYVWSFELVSLLLTVIIAGLTMFKKKGA